MRTIAVIYGDNDYYTTFKYLLETIVKAIDYREGDTNELTKENVETLIREGFKFHYMAFQMPNLKDERDVKITCDHIVNKIKVLFDEEAEKSIENADYDFGACYVTLCDKKINFY